MSPFNLPAATHYCQQLNSNNFRDSTIQAASVILLPSKKICHARQIEEHGELTTRNNTQHCMNSVLS